MLICNHLFHAVPCKDDVKPMVADKYPCDQIQIKINIYLFITILYNSSTTGIEHSPNYTAFGLSLTHQVR